MTRGCGLLICLLIGFGSFAQTSRSEKTRFWPIGSSWVGGSAPGTLSGGTINVTSAIVVIDGRIQSTDNINATLSNISINAGDTLIILGNLTLTSSSFSNNGVLIVFGNVSNGLSNTFVSGSGKMVVTGNYSNALGSNTFTGPSYVYGSSSGFPAPPASGNQATLQTNDPGLYSYVNNTYVALPVILLSFSAAEDGDNVRLRWSTASEENNDYFTIERSFDGLQYSVLTTVAGAGTTLLKTDYENVDEHPYIGRSYYRLSQTDYDGTTTVYNVITVFKKESQWVEPYPNPALHEVSVDVEPGEYTVHLTDRNGQLVPPSLLASGFGTGRLTLQVSMLEPGIYIMHLFDKTDGRKRTFKVVKH